MGGEPQNVVGTNGGMVYRKPWQSTIEEHTCYRAIYVPSPYSFIPGLEGVGGFFIAEHHEHE